MKIATYKLMMRAGSDILKQLQQCYKQTNNIPLELLEQFWQNHEHLVDSYCQEFRDVIVFLMELMNDPNLREDLRYRLLKVFERLFYLQEIVELMAKEPDIVDGLISLVNNQSEAAGRRFFGWFVQAIFERNAKIPGELRNTISSKLANNFTRTVNSVLEFLRNPRVRPELLLGERDPRPLRFSETFGYLSVILDFMQRLCEKQHEPVINWNLHTKLLRLLQEVDIGRVAKELAPGALNDFFTSFMDILSFLTELLAKREPHWRPVVEVLSSALPNSTVKGVDRMLTVMTDIFKKAPIHMNKIKIDCFSLMARFARAKPDLLLHEPSMIKMILEDDFFKNARKIRFTPLEIQEAYVNWNVILRTFFKEIRDPRDSRPVRLEGLLDTLYDVGHNILANLFDQTLNSEQIKNQFNTFEILLDIFVDQSARTSVAEKSMRQAYRRFLDYSYDSLYRLFRLTVEDLETVLNFFASEQPMPKLSLAETVDIAERAANPRETIEKLMEENGTELLRNEVNFRYNFDAKYQEGTLIINNTIINNLRGNDVFIFLEETFIGRMELISKVSSVLINELILFSHSQEQLRSCEFFLKYSVFHNYRAMFRQYIHTCLLLVSRKIPGLQEKPKNLFELFDRLALRFFFRTTVRLISRSASREEVEDTYFSLCYRQSYALIEENINQIFLILLYCIREDHTDSLYSFMNAFQGISWDEFKSSRDTAGMCSHPGRVSRFVYFHRSFVKQVIYKCIQLFHNKEFEELHAFREGCSKNIDLKLECVYLLKQIYRSLVDFREIMRRMNINRLYSIRKSTFRLIVVLMEKTFEEKAPVDYLYLLLLIFQTYYELEAMKPSRAFVDFFVKYKVKLANFFIALFKSGITELRILSVEIMFMFPGDLYALFFEGDREDRRENQREQLRFTETDEAHNLGVVLDMIITALNLKSISAFSLKYSYIGVSNTKCLASKALDLLNVILNNTVINGANLSNSDKFSLVPAFNEKLDKIYSAIQYNYNAGVDPSRSSILNIGLIRPEEEVVLVMQTFIKIMGSHSKYFAEARQLFRFRALPSANSAHLSSILEPRSSSLPRVPPTANLSFVSDKNKNEFDLTNYIHQLFAELSQRKELLYEHLIRVTPSFSTIISRDAKEELRTLATFLFSLVETLVPKQREDPLTFEMLLECLFRVQYMVGVSEVGEWKQQLLLLLPKLSGLRATTLRIAMSNLEFFLGLCSERKTEVAKVMPPSGFECFRPAIFDGLNQIVETLLLEGGDEEAGTWIGCVLETFCQGSWERVNGTIDFLTTRFELLQRECPAVRIAMLNHSATFIHALARLLGRFNRAFNLQLYEDVLNFTQTFVIFVMNSAVELDELRRQELRALFSNCENFEDASLFRMLFDMRARIIFPFAENLSVVLENKLEELNTVKREIEFETYWSPHMIQQALNFITKALCVLQTQFAPVIIEKLLRTFWHLLIEIESFDNHRGNYGKVIIFEGDRVNRVEADNQRQYRYNRSLYFHQFELHIFPDDYDIHLRGFAAIVEKIVEFFIAMFAHASRAPQDFPDLETHRRNIITNLTRICFRLENKIFKAFLRGFKSTYSMNDNTFDRELKLTFCGYKFLEEENINVPNLYIISKMYVTFNQNVIYQTYFELTTRVFDKIFKHFRDIPDGPRTEEQRREDTQYFKQLRYFFKPIHMHGLKISYQMRIRIFEFLKKAINLEIIFNKHPNWRFNLYRELIFFLNKYSNTQLYDFIKENSNFIDHSKYIAFKPYFCLLYDLISDPKSICLRERISREMIEESADRVEPLQAEGWLRLLYQITYRSEYYMRTSRNFQTFFKDNIDLGRPRKPLTSNSFFCASKTFFKLLTNCLKQNPDDYSQMKIFFELFLDRNEFTPRKITQMLVFQFKTPEQHKAFLWALFDALTSLLPNRPPPSNYNWQVFFILHVATHQLSQFNAEIANQHLCLVLTKFNLELAKWKESNTRFKPENLNVLLEFFKVLFSKVHHFSGGPLPRTLPEQYLAFFADLSREASEGHKLNRHLNDLVLAELFHHFPGFVSDESRKQLFRSFLLHDDCSDEEVNMMWLEGLRLILPQHAATGSEDWFHHFREKFMSYTYRSVHAGHDVSSIKTKWNLVITLFDVFGLRYLELYVRYFKRVSLTSSDIFDQLLAIFVLITSRSREKQIVDFLESDNKKKLFDIVDNFCFCYIERRAKIVEKNYLLLKLFMLYFGSSLFDPLTLLERTIRPGREIIRDEHTHPYLYHAFLQFHLYNISLISKLLPECAKQDICNKVVEYLRWLSTGRLAFDGPRLYATFEHMRVILSVLFVHSSKLSDLLVLAYECGNRFSELNIDFFPSYFWLLVYHFSMIHISQLPNHEIIFRVPMNINNQYRKFLYKRIYSAESKLKEDSERARRLKASTREPAEMFNSSLPISGALDTYRFLLMTYLKFLAFTAFREERDNNESFRELLELIENIISKDIAFKIRHFVLQTDLLDLLLPVILPEDPSYNPEFECLRLHINTNKIFEIFRQLLNQEKTLRQRADLVSPGCITRFVHIFYRYFELHHLPLCIEYVRNLLLVHWQKIDYALLAKLVTKFTPKQLIDRISFALTRTKELETFPILDQIVLFRALELRVREIPLHITFGSALLPVDIRMSTLLAELVTIHRRGSDFIRQTALNFFEQMITDNHARLEFLYQMYDLLINDASFDEAEFVPVFLALFEIFPGLLQSEIVLTHMLNGGKCTTLTQPPTRHAAAYEPMLIALNPFSNQAASLAHFLNESPASLSLEIFTVKALLEQKKFRRAQEEIDRINKSMAEEKTPDEPPTFHMKNINAQLNYLWRKNQAVLAEWSAMSDTQRQNEGRKIFNDSGEIEQVMINFFIEAFFQERLTLRRVNFKEPFTIGYAKELRNTVTLLSDGGHHLIEKTAKLTDLLEYASMVPLEAESNREDQLTRLLQFVVESGKREVSPKLGLSRAARILNWKSLINVCFTLRDIRPKLRQQNVDQLLPQLFFEPFAFVQLGRTERLWHAPLVSIVSKHFPESLPIIQGQNIARLYKEFHYLGLSNKAEDIVAKFVEETGRLNQETQNLSAVVQLRLGLAKMRGLLGRSGSETTLEYIGTLLGHTNMKQLPNAKLFEVVFDAYYQSAAPLTAVPNELVCELTDCLSKMIEFDPAKSRRIQLFKLILQYKKLAQAGNDLLAKFKNLFQHKEHLRFFRAHLLEIANFFNKELFIETVNRKSFQSQKQMYYLLYQFRNGLGKSDLVDVEDKLVEKLRTTSNYLLMSQLDNILDSCLNSSNIFGKLMIKKIVEEHYRSGITHAVYCEALMQRYPEFDEFMTSLRAKDGTKYEKLFQMLEFFDKWTPPLSAERFCLTELMHEKKIVLHIPSKSLLKSYYTFQLEEMAVSPFVTVRSLSTDVVFDLQLTKASGKAITMRVYTLFYEQNSPTQYHVRYNILRTILFEEIQKIPAIYRVPPTPVIPLLCIRAEKVSSFNNSIRTDKIAVFT